MQTKPKKKRTTDPLYEGENPKLLDRARKLFSRELGVPTRKAETIGKALAEFIERREKVGT